METGGIGISQYKNPWLHIHAVKLAGMRPDKKKVDEGPSPVRLKENKREKRLEEISEERIDEISGIDAILASEKPLKYMENVHYCQQDQERRYAGMVGMRKAAEMYARHSKNNSEEYDINLRI